MTNILTTGCLATLKEGGGEQRVPVKRVPDFNDHNALSQTTARTSLPCMSSGLVTSPRAWMLSGSFIRLRPGQKNTRKGGPGGMKVPDH